MATSPRTVSQVRDILRTLDRRIDDARSRRLSKPSATEFRGIGESAPSTTPNTNLTGTFNENTTVGQAAPQARPLARRIERPPLD